LQATPVLPLPRQQQLQQMLLVNKRSHQSRAPSEGARGHMASRPQAGAEGPGAHRRYLSSDLRTSREKRTWPL
jgi:hypothetical protein